MISVIATALGLATVAITLMSGSSPTAASGTAGGTLVDAQIVEVYVFLLAAFTGYQIITKVPPLLHTPLMAATNAISGISLVGSLVVAGSGHGTLASVLGFVAVAAATTNVVGGFLITDRMLGMFKRDEKKAAPDAEQGGGERRESAP